MILIDLNNKKIWDEALKSKKHFIGHSWDYAKFQSINNIDLRPHLLIFDEINKQNFCVVNIGNYKKYKYLFSLSGYSGYNNFFQKNDFIKIKEILSKQNFITYYFVTNKIFSNDNEKHELSNFYEKKNNVYVLSLEKKLNDIYSSFNNNLKRKIKLCIKQKISTIEKSNYEDIINLYYENNKRLNLNKSPIFNIESINFIIKDFEKKIILNVYLGKKICSCVIILYNQNYAEYLTSFSLKDYNYLTGFILFESIKFLKKKGIKYFNLGGGVKNINGIEKFKKSFGCDVIDQYQTKLVVDEQNYLNETKDISNEYFPKFING